MTLAAFAPPWLAVGVMLAWSLTATVVYRGARDSGFPDVFAAARFDRSAGLKSGLPWAASYCVRVWLAGLSAFIFARFARLALQSGRGPLRTLKRAGVLGVGFTFFGVSTADHLLRQAGYAGAQLRRISLIAPLLNVPYRFCIAHLVARLIAHLA